MILDRLKEITCIITVENTDFLIYLKKHQSRSWIIRLSTTILVLAVSTYAFVKDI